MIVLSNVLTLQETAIYSGLEIVSIIWTVFLVFIGIMTVHQFTMKKTLLTMIVAVVGMIVMITVGLLFLSLVQQITNFAEILTDELSMR